MKPQLWVCRLADTTWPKIKLPENAVKPEDVPARGKLSGFWLKLSDGLNYADAMKRARKEQRDDLKLRAKGGKGNWRSVDIRLSFDGPGRKEYAVWVQPA